MCEADTEAWAGSIGPASAWEKGWGRTEVPISFRRSSHTAGTSTDPAKAGPVSCWRHVGRE
jgi:hypothetical protein